MSVRNWIPTVEISPRYGIVGIYKDRDLPVVRIYPVWFVRISIGVREFRAGRRAS